MKPSMKKYVSFAAATLVTIGALTGSSASGVGAESVSRDSDRVGPAASLEGQPIDLSDGWDGAKACVVTTEGTTCYRSEKEMDVSLRRVSSAGSTTSSARAASGCSPYVRFYDGTSFTGVSLTLLIGWSGINLASYGFDNRASSYKVGSCNADFFTGANFGGSLYPGYTGAGAQYASMGSYNNQISSLIIYG